MTLQISGGLDRAPLELVEAEMLWQLPPYEAPVVPREAVAKAQAGDVESFEWLVRTYEAELFRLALRMLSNRGDAEDVVQEAFVTAWRRLPTLLDPDAFHAWICQIATHLCINLIRSRARRKTEVTASGDLDVDARLGASEAETAQDPADRAQMKAQVQALGRAVAALPVEQRTSWILREIHDLSYPEIANAVDVPVSTVRGRIARARQALAADLAQWRQLSDAGAHVSGRTVRLRLL